MSQCWHFKTTMIEWLWVNVYPFSFTKRHIDRRIHNRSWLWLTLTHKFPCADEQFNVLSGCFFWLFCDVFVDTIHNANPWNCSVLKQMIRSWYQCNNVLREDKVAHPRLDRSSYLNESHSRSGCCECVFSTCCLHNLRSFLNCDEKLSFLNLF